MLAHEIRVSISNLSPDELIQILHSGTGYTPEAVAFAQEELAGRGYTVLGIGADLDVVTPSGLRVTAPGQLPADGQVIAPGPAVAQERADSGRTPRYAYILAMLLGVIIPFGTGLAILFIVSPQHMGSGVPLAGRIVSTQLLVMLAAEGALGFALGYAWPRDGWKWGIWLLPLVFIWMVAGRAPLGPFLLAVPACFGAWLGARLSSGSEVSA